MMSCALLSYDLCASKKDQPTKRNQMVAGLLALVTVGGVGYYLFRLAPRVMSRVNNSSGAMGAAAMSSMPYRQYVYGFDKIMSEREALLILGLEDTSSSFQRPSKEKVREHYRQVMAHLHSDVGGSPYIATKINEARDVLSGR